MSADQCVRCGGSGHSSDECKWPVVRGQVTVDAKALFTVLRALNGPAHHIRELQATRNTPGSNNPISKLVDQYNRYVTALAKEPS